MSKHQGSMYRGNSYIICIYACMYSVFREINQIKKSDQVGKGSTALENKPIYFLMWTQQTLASSECICIFLSVYISPFYKGVCFQNALKLSLQLFGLLVSDILIWHVRKMREGAGEGCKTGPDRTFSKLKSFKTNRSTLLNYKQFVNHHIF